jgi:hypothetical protein
MCRRSRWQSSVLEFELLDAAEIIALDDRAVLHLGPFNRKPEQALAFGVLILGKIPGQRDHVQSTDGAHMLPARQRVQFGGDGSGDCSTRVGPERKAFCAVQRILKENLVVLRSWRMPRLNGRFWSAAKDLAAMAQ